MKALMLIVAALLMAGCASVPMASSDQDARAKTFAVAPGKANIYVYRNEMMGAAIKMPVILDGKDYAVWLGEAEGDQSVVTEAEKAWLNAYHARVREVVDPQVDEATKAWLKEATRAI